MATLTTGTILATEQGKNALPKNIVDSVWKLSFENAVIPQLATSTPMIIGDNIIPFQTKRPAASIVGENQNKSASEVQFDAKVIKPIKAVVGLEFSLETVLSNPVNVMATLEEELSAAIARQIDLAVIHGKEAETGNQISTVTEYLNKTENRVSVPDNANEIDAALWEGYGKTVGTRYGFNGFAFDPRLAFKIANARDNQGRRLNPEMNIGDGNLTNFSGVKAAVSNTVSGAGVDAVTDQGVLGFGGDWSTLKWGRASEIMYDVIPYGDPFGNGDLQRRNAIAYRMEVIFGFGFQDLNAFVAYDAPTGTAGAKSAKAA